MKVGTSHTPQYCTQRRCSKWQIWKWRTLDGKMTLNCGKSDPFVRPLSYDNLTVLSLLTVQWRQQVSWQVHEATHTCFLNTVCYLVCIILLNYSSRLFKPFRMKLMYKIILTFRHRASCILGQAFRYSPENAFYIFNQQIYFIIWYLLERVSFI